MGADNTFGETNFNPKKKTIKYRGFEISYVGRGYWEATRDDFENSPFAKGVDELKDEIDELIRETVN